MHSRLIAFCMALLPLAAVAQAAEEVLAEKPMLPRGKMLLVQALFVAAQVLMYGSLVTLAAIIIRRLFLRIRLVPQGRWIRGILTATGAFLVFVAFAGLFLWAVRQPDGARLLMYGALTALLVFIIGGFVRPIRQNIERLGRTFMITLPIFLMGIAACGGMFDSVLSVPSRDLRNRDWAHQPGTLTELGQAAPEFAVITLDGARVSLAEQRERVMVLDFFQTYCGPCKEELDALERRVWEKFRGKPLTVIAISLGESEEKVRAFRERYGYTLPMAIDTDGSIRAKYATAEGRVPRTYVIDRAGRIVYQCTGFYAPQVEKMIKVVRSELHPTQS